MSFALKLTLLLLTFIIRVVEIHSFTPVGRAYHSSTLVGSRLYIFGGATSNGSSELSQTLFLDVSQPFDPESPPWTLSKEMPFRSSYATTSFIDLNNYPTIDLFGGFMLDPASHNDSFESFIHTFDLENLKWEIPKTRGRPPERRRNVQAVRDGSEKVYIFGGVNFKTPNTLLGDMIILDSETLTWLRGTTTNVPTARHHYTATILLNGVIVYIGGCDDLECEKAVDINEISLYDTTRDSWNVMMAKDVNAIQSRHGHSAVLAPDERIIICGGAFTSENFQVTPNVVVLNTKTVPFEWVIPQVSSNIDHVPSLVGHTANLFGDLMIVAFGNITQQHNFPLTVKNSAIYLLDVRNHTWVNSFNLSEGSLRNDTIQSTSTKLFILAICGGLGVTFLVACGTLIYKGHKKRKEKRMFEGSGSFDTL